MPDDPKEIVRRGYDAVSERYRADCLYVLIHLPESEQEALIRCFRSWLRPKGLLLATVGATAWTGEETDRLGGGARMWWRHPGADTYRGWLGSAGLTVEQDEFVPEGNGGHQLLVARFQ